MQEDDAEVISIEMCDDEGYSGSQEKSASTSDVSSDISKEDNIFKNYFSDTLNLQDLSFHLMCADASGFPESVNELPFKNL